MTGFCLTTSPKRAFYRVNCFLLQNVIMLLTERVNTLDSIKDVMDECHSALGMCYFDFTY